MSCRAVTEQFDERLDGRLDEPRQTAFDAHLTGCAECRREWAAYAGAWQALDRDEGIEPSFGFAERTLRRLNEPQVAVRWWVWRPSLRWVALAATVVVLGVGGWVEHERTVARKTAETYVRIQQADYLEDFDVIANLDQLKGNNQL
ncbi:MAG: zf-HC2 domain-containing protein [Verrucomicrobiia bacterium]|jgi:anti-sigma factor RsiW